MNRTAMGLVVAVAMGGPAQAGMSVMGDAELDRTVAGTVIATSFASASASSSGHNVSTASARTEVIVTSFSDGFAQTRHSVAHLEKRTVSGVASAEARVSVVRQPLNLSELFGLNFLRSLQISIR